MVIKQGIVVINSGSSSIKCALFIKNDQDLIQTHSCVISGIAQAGSGRIDLAEQGNKTSQQLEFNHHEAALDWVMNWLSQLPNLHLLVVGHRVVHGGTLFHQPVLITDTVLTQLKQLIPLAPLHQPHNLKAIELFHVKHPELPQIACFDTAFHYNMPLVAQKYALPNEYFEQGIRAYGFHGLSYEYINSILPQYAGERAKQKVIVAHLGNGASVSAILNGKSIATSMGFTPLDGLVMGTRCGSIDPGVLLHLLNQGMTNEQLSQLLSKQSGLLGLSGMSSNMATLINSEDETAQQAIEQFCYQLIKHIGAYIALLEGLDVLVFTGGIGEHATSIRNRICTQLNWLGLQIDESLNQQEQDIISSEKSSVLVCRLATNEEKMIALHCQELTYVK